MIFRLMAFLIVVWLFTIRLIKIKGIKKKHQHFRLCIVIQPFHSFFKMKCLNSLFLMVKLWLSIKVYQEISKILSQQGSKAFCGNKPTSNTAALLVQLQILLFQLRKSKLICTSDSEKDSHLQQRKQNSIGWKAMALLPISLS